MYFGNQHNIDYTRRQLPNNNFTTVLYLAMANVFFIQLIMHILCQGAGPLQNNYSI